jgi:hypothetical protein
LVSGKYPITTRATYVLTPKNTPERNKFDLGKIARASGYTNTGGSPGYFQANAASCIFSADTYPSVFVNK